MLRWLAVAALWVGVPLFGQTMCPPTPAYSVCDITFDVPANTPRDAELNAEFRGPSHRTFLVRAFASTPQRWIIRFSPFEAGAWDVRLSSSIAAFHDKQLPLSATASNSQGWIEAANVHHFRYTGGQRLAHLWLGDTLPESLDRATFESWVTARAAAGVNHVRVRVPNRIDERAFDELDSRLAFLNQKEIIADLVLTPPAGETRRESRQAFFRYVISRCAARNATWIMLNEFEKYDHAHDLLREISGYLDEDPYHHLRTAGAQITSGTFADEKWMQVRSYGSPAWSVSAIEDQIYSIPAVSLVQASSAEAFRHQLWNATMSGTYPSAAATDAGMVSALRAWHELLADTRHWDEEPFFDVEGARGLSLPDTEYILYVEKSGPVTVHFENKHKWNVDWFNPLNGERTSEKDFRDETYSGEPPDRTHDWVLHIYREGHMESLKGYRFEAREVILQDVEVSAAKVPFQIAQPSTETIDRKQPVPFSVRVTKETRGTKSMIYLWTGEVTADGEGYRVLGTQASGTLQVPEDIVRRFPATLHVRLYGLNALGKLYSLDQNFGLTE